MIGFRSIWAVGCLCVLVAFHPLFKWKSWPPEYHLYCWSPGRTNPGFVQDITECPAVAVVLYPYHEFL
jgi:hypothetical protein